MPGQGRCWVCSLARQSSLICSPTRAGRGQVIGQGGQLRGVTAEAFHLVHGEDDPAVRGVGLDLPGQRERRLELLPYPDPGSVRVVTAGQAPTRPERARRRSGYLVTWRTGPRAARFAALSSMPQSVIRPVA